MGRSKWQRCYWRRAVAESLPDDLRLLLDQVQAAPFKVHEEKPVCSCGEGGQWTVEYPDGSVLSRSWCGPTGKESAEEVADWLNDAWISALDAVRSAAGTGVTDDPDEETLRRG
jgi:hypothetical protein